MTMGEATQKDLELSIWLTPEQVRSLARRFEGARQRGARLHLHALEGQATSIDVDFDEPDESTPQGPEEPPIEDVIQDLFADVPDGAWDSLPADLTDHLDHYLYGTPKT